jgi:hypothetical protein
VKRGKPLSRGTKGLARTAGLSRGTGLPRTERKRKPARDTGPSAKVRALVLARDGYACVCCGRSVIGQPYSLQHRKRRSQGGDNSPSNLITVLGTGSTGCHERIDSRREPGDEANGYTVRSWDDPELVPVTFFSQGSGVTLWLTRDGKRTAVDPNEAAA